jgi:hypothetical protein
MKYSLKFISFLFVTLFFASCAEKQQQQATLYQAQVSAKTQVVEEKVFTKEIGYGPDFELVPLKISWTVFLNNEGCWKIADVTVDRNGGHENVVISGIRHSTDSKCVADLEPVDDKRFEMLTIFLNYNYRSFIKSYSDTNYPVIVRGDGKPAIGK